MRKPAYTCNILVSCSEFTTNFKITSLSAKGFNIDYITLFLKDLHYVLKVWSGIIRHNLDLTSVANPNLLYFLDKHLIKHYYNPTDQRPRYFKQILQKIK